jgi:pimeloyl-ACP methyl ester carboxylesterase
VTGAWDPPIAAPDRLVTARGAVAVWERGSGMPLICLPAYPDHAIGLLSTLDRFADAGLRAIAISYPGYWPSEPAPDADYSMEAVARDLVGVMDALGFDTAHVFGHGWGALYGYFLGSHHPERLRSLVAVAAPHPAGFAVRHSVVLEQQTAAYAMLLAYASVGRELALDRRWLTSLAQTWSPGLYRDDWPAVLACLTRPRVADAVVAYYRADLEGVGAQTGTVAVPTTVIHGAQAACIRPAAFAGLDRWFSAGLTTHLLPRVGHWPHLEDPETTIGLALAAIEAQP